jgi:cytochrome c oxidase subunit I+III
MLYAGFMLGSGPTPAGSATCRWPVPDYAPGKGVDFWAQMITFTELSALLEAIV